MHRVEYVDRHGDREPGFIPELLPVVRKPIEVSDSRYPRGWKFSTSLASLASYEIIEFAYAGYDFMADCYIYKEKD